MHSLPSHPAPVNPDRPAPVNPDARPADLPDDWVWLVDDEPPPYRTTADLPPTAGPTASSTWPTTPVEEGRPVEHLLVLTMLLLLALAVRLVKAAAR
jgi:hypothetical protein